MSGMYTRQDCERGAPFRDHILSHKLLTAMNDSTWPRTEHPHTALLEPKLNPSTVAWPHKRTPLDEREGFVFDTFSLTMWATWVVGCICLCPPVGIHDISI